MIFSGREAHSRSLAKAVSWRLTGTIDTFAGTGLESDSPDPRRGRPWPQRSR